MFVGQHPLISVIHRNAMCFFEGGASKVKTKCGKKHYHVTDTEEFPAINLIYSVINIHDNRATFKKLMKAERWGKRIIMSR